MRSGINATEKAKSRLETKSCRIAVSDFNLPLPDENITIAKYHALAKAGNTDALFNLGLIYCLSSAHMGDWTNAREYWLISANRGNIHAQLITSLWHLFGGFNKESGKYFEMATKQMNQDYNLAAFKRLSGNIKAILSKRLSIVNEYKSFMLSLYRFLADHKNNAEAQYEVGNYFALSARGVVYKQEYVTLSRKYFELSANNGNAKALEAIGDIYLEENNLELALKYYFKAVMKGNTVANNSLNVLRKSINNNFIAALKSNDEKNAEKWLSLGASTSYQNSDMIKLPLAYTVEKRNLSMSKLLLSNGAGSDTFTIGEKADKETQLFIDKAWLEIDKEWSAFIMLLVKHVLLEKENLVTDLTNIIIVIMFNLHCAKADVSLKDYKILRTNARIAMFDPKYPLFDTEKEIIKKIENKYNEPTSKSISLAEIIYSARYENNEKMLQTLKDLKYLNEDESVHVSAAIVFKEIYTNTVRVYNKLGA